MIDFSAVPNTLVAFPSTVAVDDPTGVGNAGTPLLKQWVDDYFGFSQALLYEVGFTPDGYADAAVTGSQRLDAMKRMFHEQTAPPGITNQQIAERTWSAAGAGSSWCNMWSPQNTISAGGGTSIVDLAVGFPVTGGKTYKRLLMLDYAGNQILSYDPATLALVTSSGALGDLGAGTWQPTAFCSDGTYVFVMFLDTALTPNETHKVQSYVISDAGAWATNPGWPAGGTALAGTGTNGTVPGLAAPLKQDRIIIADAVNVATMNSWNALPLAASPGVSIITRGAGALVASGAGDVVPAANKYPTNGAMCSDGTNIYYMVFQVGGGWVLATAQIANPAIGSGGGGFPHAEAIAYDAIWTGDFIVVPPRDVAHMHLELPNMAAWGDLNKGTAMANYLCASATFDGKNLFVYCEDSAGTPINKDVIFCVRMDGVSGICATADTAQARFFPLDEAEATCNALIDDSGRLVWDGDSVWAAVDNRSGQTYSGIVRRVPRTAVRG